MRVKKQNLSHKLDFGIKLKVWGMQVKTSPSSELSLMINLKNSMELISEMAAGSFKMIKGLHTRPKLISVIREKFRSSINAR